MADDYPGGWANLEVRSDIGSMLEVTLSRPLDDQRGLEDDDPDICIEIRGHREPDDIKNLKASDLDDLIEALQQVRDLAKRFRIIPPALDFKERRLRAIAAEADVESNLHTTTEA
jgi:hypothetical protein